MSGPERPGPDGRLAERERPAGRPVGFQRWSDLLFLHWSVDAAQIQQSLPPGLQVDTFGGKAYLGIVPFSMRRIRPAWLPAVPWLSWFLELNVRTYVYDRHGRPGVYFYSLDCSQPVAVAVARRFFHLPYFHADMRLTRRGGGVIDYHCQRNGLSSERARFRWREEVGDVAVEAEPGTLEFFLVERYRLFAAHRRSGKLLTGRVHHRPYRIAAAEVAELSTVPAAQAGFDLDGAPDSCIMAQAVDVAVFRLESVP